MLEWLPVAWLWLGGVFTVAVVVKEKGQDVAPAVVFSILFSPLVGAIYAIGMPSKRNP